MEALSGGVQHLLEMDESDIHNGVGLVLVANMFFGFLVLHLISAPYGRYSRGGWGFDIGARAAWVVQESPCLIAVAACWFLRTRELPVANVVLLGLFALHYVNRTLVFPFLIRGGKPTPLFVVACALFFCSCNGYLIARDLTHFTMLAEDHHTTPRFVAGVLLFFAGFFFNVQADSILRNLRKPGDTGYYIPRGGLFTYVTAANYAGELLEWVGFALAAGTLPAAFFFVNTFFNLFPRAKTHHQWYLKKFEDYPKERRVIVPFVY